MNTIKKIMLAVALMTGVVGSAVPMEQQVEEANVLLAKYAPPQEICAQIKKLEADGRYPKFLEEFVAHDGRVFLCKGGDLDRFINSELLRRLIQGNRQIHLDVTQKYIYGTNDIIIVLAEKIKGDSVSVSEFSLGAQEELKVIAKITGFFDDHRGNFLCRNGDSKFVFIDTESGAFFRDYGFIAPTKEFAALTEIYPNSRSQYELIRAMNETFVC